MKLKKAQMEDLDTIMTILKDGRNQLKEKGINQWQGEYPNEKHVKQDIENGYAYLFNSDDGQTVGVVSIVSPPDHSYDKLDGNWLMQTDNYRTIHRVAVHSKHAGHGYASKLFEGLLNYFENERDDIDSLRIDTHQDNKTMQHLIEKNGFTRIGSLHGVYRKDQDSYVYAKLLHQKNKQ